LFFSPYPNPSPKERGFRKLLLKQKRLPLFGGRRSFGLFLCFTPYDYLPPCFTPVVVIVVIMALLLFIYNACKVTGIFFNKQGLIKILSKYKKTDG